MDFATEEKLCRLAHEVWRQVASEPYGGDRDAELPRAASDAGYGGDASAAEPQPW